MVYYQLRRIGKPATVFGVKDVLKLTKDVNKFGRHSQNDHFLDSAEYMCLISRWHAEIHKEYGGGKVKFVLSDNGLNGTFVNDVRVDGSIVIEVGDVITFGHPNGKKIKPGERSEQNDSEFSFMFEKVNEDLPEDSILKSEPTLDQEMEYKPHIKSINNNSETLLKHSMPGYSLKTEGQISASHMPQQVLPVVEGVGSVQHVVEETDIKPKNIDLSQVGRSGSLNSKLNTDHIGQSTFILKDISNKNSSQGLVHLDELFSNQNKVNQSSQMTVSLNNFNAQRGSVSGSQLRDSGSVDSDEDIFKSASHQTSQDYLSTQEASTSQKLPVTISQLQMHLQKPSMAPSLYPPLSSILDKPSQLTTESAGLTVGQVKGKGRRGSAGGRKRSVSIRSEEVEDGGTKKRRRKSTAKNKNDVSLNFTVDHSNEEELPTFHYDGDRCDSYDCCQPLASTVSWVQCDDCDKWYHTACAGTNYDEVKQSNAEFHCGCSY